MKSPVKWMGCHSLAFHEDDQGHYKPQYHTTLGDWDLVFPPFIMEHEHLLPLNKMWKGGNMGNARRLWKIGIGCFLGKYTRKAKPMGKLRVSAQLRR
jgi:hypothetical protein